MRLSPADIEVLCAEVEAAAGGAVVQHVRDGRPGDEVQLELRQPGRTLHLMLSVGVVAPRLHLMPARAESPAEPTAFVGLLRKHLIGTRLQAVAAVSGDRIARLLFERVVWDSDSASDGPGASGEPGEEAWFLAAELLGRRANLLLVDADGVVRGASSPAAAAARGTAVGEVWQPPEPPAFGLTATSLVVGSASVMVASAAAAALATAELEHARGELRRALRGLEKRIGRRVENLSADTERADDADRLRRLGDLLRSAYGNVPRGANAVKVVDWAAPGGGEVVIAIDPARSLGENIQRYFKEGKRLAAAKAGIAERLGVARAQLGRVEEALAALEQAADSAAIDGVRAGVADLLPRPRPTLERARRREAPALPYWQFTSRSGATILVGKGERENDQLTFRVGRGRDLWLHVDGAAGSHVIVRVAGTEGVDAETLLDAATLAAHYSKLRKDGVVDVRYTHQKYVRKPKGAPPGRVSIADAKTVAVRMDPERVARLFGTKS